MLSLQQFLTLLIFYLLALVANLLPKTNWAYLSFNIQMLLYFIIIIAFILVILYGLFIRLLVIYDCLL